MGDMPLFPRPLSFGITVHGRRVAAASCGESSARHDCFEHVVSPFKSKAESCLHETGQMAPTGDEAKSVRRAIRFGLGKQKTAACPPSFPSSLSPASGRWACQHSSARGRPRDRLADASCWRRTSYAWREHPTKGTLPRHSTGFRTPRYCRCSCKHLSSFSGEETNFRCRPVN